MEHGTRARDRADWHPLLPCHRHDGVMTTRRAGGRRGGRPHLQNQRRARRFALDVDVDIPVRTAMRRPARSRCGRSLRAGGANKAIPESQIEPTAMSLNASVASLGSIPLTPQPPRSLGRAPRLEAHSSRRGFIPPKRKSPTNRTRSRINWCSAPELASKPIQLSHHRTQQNCATSVHLR